jgi:endonuclease/exonuclease/phosphatase family metal-dependent hydrolase
LKLRVITWNVHSWLDSYFRHQFPEMLSVLRDLRPDLLFFQEARWDPGRGVYSPEISELRAELELEGFAMCPTHLSPVRRQAVGHLILSRVKLCNHQIVDIGSSFSIHRKLLLAQLQLGRQMITVGTTHLSPMPLPSMPAWHWEWLPRPSEMRRLLKALAKVETPLVLGLDMNATPQTKDFKRLAEVLSPTSADHSSLISGLCVDFIFCTPKMPVSHYSLQLSTSPSDHYPVVADFILPG